MKNTIQHVRRGFILLVLVLVLMFALWRVVEAVRSTGGESDTFSIDTISSVLLFSSTHPDEDRWYNHNDPAFSWTALVRIAGIV